jgi:methylenetetrahydrofolate--tRNA-(uracil-5-)-methyltransferase
MQGTEPVLPPEGTMLGGLCRYLAQAEERHFQPMKANLGLLPPPEKKRLSKWDRSRLQSALAREAFDRWWTEVSDL